MPIYYINTGTSPNAGNGDVLRTAFWKVNQNFAYVTSTIFSTIATDIIPAVDNTYSLGSPAKQWKELFVSTGSIYLGNVKLSTDNGQLQIQTVTYSYNTSTGQITTETVTSGYAAPTVVPNFTVTNTLTVATIRFGDGTTQTTAGGLLGYTGSIGATGYTGSIGSIGYVGSVGSTGAIGYTGSAGDVSIFSNQSLYTTSSVTFNTLTVSTINLSGELITVNTSAETLVFNNDDVLTVNKVQTYRNKTYEGQFLTVATGTSFVPYDYTQAMFITEVNNFSEVAIKNISNAGESSADFVCYNDQGDGTTFYIDMGMNSSNYNSGDYPIFTPDSGYLYTGGGTGATSDLIIGTATSGSHIKLFSGGVGTQDVRMIIHGDTGNVIVGHDPMFDDGINDLQVVGFATITETLSVSKAIYTEGVIVNTITATNIRLAGGNIYQIPDVNFVIRAQDAQNDGWALKLEVDDGAGTVYSRIDQTRDQIQLGLINVGKYWQFNNSGNLVLPGDIYGNYAGTLIIQVPGSDANSLISLQTRDNSDTLRSSVTVGTDNVVVATASGANTWTFRLNGDLTIPGNIRMPDDVAIVPNTNDNAGLWLYQTSTNNRAQLAAIGPINLRADSANAGVEWTFDIAGNLMVPGNTIVFVNTSTGGMGGKGITIRAGASDEITWNSNPGGNINIIGGYGSFGDGGGGAGGNINIIGGGSSDSTAGIVNVISGANTWTFSNAGTLTFPDNTIQTTAYTGGSGVSSITAGTGTSVSTSTGDITIWSTGGGAASTGDITFTNATLSALANQSITVAPNGTGTFIVSAPIISTVGVHEVLNTKSSATGVVVHDCSTGTLFYHTTPSANFTCNFTNLRLAAFRATSVSLVVQQGATARVPNAVQIDGTTSTIVWQGSATAPAGNASRIDVFTFNILNTGTNIVLGMLTSFGGV